MLINLQTYMNSFRNLKKKDVKKKDVKFAKIADGYASGRPQLVFDGELTETIKTYPYLASYTPASSDRVMVIHNVVVGKII
jgi:hypothetical protein